MRVTLAAPALGSAVAVIPAFTLSNAGIHLQKAGPVALIVIAAASAAVLVFRRPRLPIATLPVAAVALVHLGLAGRPMFRFGFHWIANANGDMGYYVLSATSLLHSGLRDPVDRVALVRDYEFATVAHALYELGVRVGADVVLSSLSALTGKFAAEIYMPLTLSISMAGVFAAGALAMQFAVRARAAVAAAALLAMSPLATYGVVQQLLPQVWGLSLAAALFALLMRPEIHARAQPSLAQLAPIWVLAIALFLVYVELAASLCLAYALYVSMLLIRRRASLTAVLRVVGPAVVGIVVLANLYLPRTVEFVATSARAGVEGRVGLGQLQLFGRAMVPSAVPALLGFQSLFASMTAPLMSVSIAAAIVLAGALTVAVVVGARRGMAACVVLATDLALAAVLAVERSDFGLFKLYMYAQPFLAAAVGVWLVGARSRRSALAVATLAPLLIAIEVHTQASYVSQSVNPTDVPHASEADLLPAFRSLLKQRVPTIVTTTDNVPLGSLEAAAADVERHPLEFLAGNPFGFPARPRTFPTSRPKRPAVRFEQSARVLRLIANQRCELAASSGSQHVLNRRKFPEGSPDIIPVSCSDARDLLVFVVSSVGERFYARNRRSVSFWQLERDPAFPRRTMSGFGRYALLQVVNPTAGVRLELDYSASFLRDPKLSFVLPRATVTGTREVSLPVVGVGSARVFSPPLRPLVIGGQSYLLLDMGKGGFLPPVRRRGLMSLWGRSVQLDPRLLTSYVRNISLVGAKEYRTMHAPAFVATFPRDLENEDLAYSGIFEDGWLGRDAYAVLDPGAATRLTLQADVIPAASQRLAVTIDGARVWSGRVKAGALNLTLPLRASARSVRVGVHWSDAMPLGPRDPRPAAARLRFLGFAPPPAQIANIARDLARPGVDADGVSSDGWLARRARIVLAGGEAGKFVLRADAPVVQRQFVRVTVNGRVVAARPVAPGSFQVSADVPASSGPRTVVIAWARAPRLGPADPRYAAARLTYVGVVRVAAPTRIRIPVDLGRRDLAISGVAPDGWSQRRASVVVSGGPAANLVLRGSVPIPQRVTVRVNGTVVANSVVAPGSLDLAAPVPPSRGPRRVRLEWARTTSLARPDRRRTAALLRFVGIVVPPASVDLPADRARLAGARGVFSDGWAKKDVALTLPGGRAAVIVFRGIVPAMRSQRVTVVVDGRTVADHRVRAGRFRLRAVVRATRELRRVELHWASDVRLAPPDVRRAAALLRAIRALPLPRHVAVGSALGHDNVVASGVYADGWSKRSASVVLAGGPAARLIVAAQVPRVVGQRLTVVVDGRRFIQRRMSPGSTRVHVQLPKTDRPRSVLLRWSRTATLKPPDGRVVAARLDFVGVAR